MPNIEIHSDSYGKGTIIHECLPGKLDPTLVAINDFEVVYVRLMEGGKEEIPAPVLSENGGEYYAPICYCPYCGENLLVVRKKFTI